MINPDTWLVVGGEFVPFICCYLKPDAAKGGLFLLVTQGLLAEPTGAAIC
jgi:hypothetical protein